MGVVVQWLAEPPTEPMELPGEVTSTINTWLSWLLYIAMALCVAAIILLLALQAADKDRGEAVSATSPQIAWLRIAIGVLVLSSGGKIVQAVFF